ncbi:bifunctional adenosylcobinamide kinase/adenosylcobinamide-phosphate guanylyltransferase [Butyrivibrio sp. VCD2006]|uniref:bifunctional adenosylcobinamide kinase/adenosylcobinamide-phosphate guanylyltransferase n=1 Tax=Butyrivibrio sp. VCD2006 TaxID=1280664 RepID=UPI0004067746|nr:bifunctional adenosylcobinamide kinase/adenosylcobinamide-phosphate guanylyltransferase [Butyrivibrio sp. VCD2006]
MTVLIIGVPDSGKSQKAEEIAVKLAGGGQKLYIATMIPFGDEGKKRVEKHRKLREGKGFETIECPVKIDELSAKDSRIEGATCLLECMSNLIGNEMHSDSNKDISDEELSKKIADSVLVLRDRAKNLVIVSNSFPIDDLSYDEDTKRYCSLVLMVNEALKKYADEIHEFADERWT